MKRGEGGEGTAVAANYYYPQCNQRGGSLRSGLTHLWPPAVFRRYVWIHSRIVCVCQEHIYYLIFKHEGKYTHIHTHTLAMLGH